MNSVSPFSSVSLVEDGAISRLAPGTLVGKYRVEELLSDTTHSMVYRVKHERLLSQHALKVVQTSSPSVRSRFLHAGRVQARLLHINLVAITDVLVHDGAPALVMEFADGPRLDQYLTASAPSLEERIQIFKGVVCGARHAHRGGLVHSHLRPSNILLTKVDGAFVPKITAFGLGDMGRKQTPNYTAPEQLRDVRRIDQRSDLFSLGCILYEMVCGVPAFPGGDTFAIIHAITKGRYIPPTDHAPDLPSEIDAMIRALLQVDPNDRPQEAVEILTALEPRASLPSLSAAELAHDVTVPHTSRSVLPADPAPRLVMWGVMAICVAIGLLLMVGLLGYFSSPHRPAMAPATGGAQPTVDHEARP